MKQGVKKNTKQTDDHGKCKTCGACKECGSQPAPAWITAPPVYIPVYIQPFPTPAYPNIIGPTWQVFPNTGMTVSETITGLTVTNGLPPHCSASVSGNS